MIDALAATPVATDTGSCGTNGKLVKGKVNTGNLTLRTTPDKSADAITVLKAGSSLTILGTSSSGAWLAVKTPDGLTGWVGAAFVYLTAGKLIDIQIVDPASIASSSASATLAATMSATAMATAAGTAVATPCATPAVGASATNGKVVTAKVAVASLRLRSTPDNSAETLKTLSKGENVTILGTSASGAWFLAETSDGIIGWVGAAYVTLTEGKLIDIQIVSNDAASAATPAATQVGTPAS